MPDRFMPECGEYYSYGDGALSHEDAFSFDVGSQAITAALPFPVQGVGGKNLSNHKPLK